ncbi:MAG: hypothetical protein ABEI74_02680 [Candidatus Pacearchaeota archaeon]
MEFRDEVKGGSLVVKEFSPAPEALGSLAIDQKTGETIASANLVPKFKDIYANKTSENLAYDIYVRNGRDQGLVTKLKDFEDRNIASEFMHQNFYSQVDKYAESKEMNVDWKTYQHNRISELPLIKIETPSSNNQQTENARSNTQKQENVSKKATGPVYDSLNSH